MNIELIAVPENVVRKDKKLMDLHYEINGIQNKLYFLNNKHHLLKEEGSMQCHQFSAIC